MAENEIVTTSFMNGSLGYWLYTPRTGDGIVFKTIRMIFFSDFVSKYQLNKVAWWIISIFNVRFPEIRICFVN